MAETCMKSFGTGHRHMKTLKLSVITLKVCLY
jgi:hypothetical protein